MTDENTATNSDYDSDTNIDRDRATMNTASDDEDDDDNDVHHQYSQYANEYESPEDKFFESLNMSHAQNELLIGMDDVGQQDKVFINNHHTYLYV